MPYIPIEEEVKKTSVNSSIVDFFESDNSIIISFIGTLGHFISDLETVYKGVQKLNMLPRKEKYKLIVCGNGDKFSDYVKYESDYIFHPGFLGQQEITYILNKSDIGIMPYPNTKMWQNTIPNKFIEYLSKGLFIVTSLNEGMVFNEISQNQLGLSYTEGDPDSFANELIKIKIKDLRKTQSLRLDYFKNNFSTNQTQKKLDQLINTHSNNFTNGAKI
jgi:hypothetical protein